MHYLLAAIMFLAPQLGEPVAKTYARIIRVEADRRHVDPLLVVSFIHIETYGSWNPRAKGPTNDYGLTQIHVAARGSARFLGREEELYKPKVNIREWVRLADMWRNYHRKNCGVWRQICYSGPEGLWGCSDELIVGAGHQWWDHLKWGYKVKAPLHKVAKLYKLLKQKFDLSAKSKSLSWGGDMSEASELKWANQETSSWVPEAIKAWAAKFENKNDNYGNSWLLSGETLSLWFPQGLILDSPRKQIMHGLITRMLDKLIRAAHIELAGVQDKVGEKASETFFDLGVYAFMAGCACFLEAGKEAFMKALQTQAATNSVGASIRVCTK